MRKIFWFIGGVFAFLAIALYGSYASLDATHPGLTLYSIVEWFAAAIPYFFMGALAGHCIDWTRAKVKKQPFKHPLWVWLTLFFWILSVVGAYTIPKETTPLLGGSILTVLFPLAYGIFFNGYAYSFLFPTLISQSLLVKLTLDLVYLALFSLLIFKTGVETKQTSTPWYSYRNLSTIVLFLLSALGATEVLASH